MTPPLTGPLRRWAAIALLAVALAPHDGARAEDYGPNRSDWNGLGYLQVTAEEAKVEASLVDALQLDELGPYDVLFWMFPSSPVPVDQLLRFVSDGGGLVIADDFGASGELLGAIGLERTMQGPTSHGRWFENEDGFPALRTADATNPRHFLFFNVEEVVANHPTVLVGDGSPVLSFDGGAEHLIIERTWGAGAVLAIGDPSMFLNEMLGRFYGNKQLAANVMRYFCREEPCRVRILMPHTSFSGEYRSGAGPLGTFPRAVERAVESLDEALVGVEEDLGGPPWWFLIGLALGGAALVFAVIALAMWRRPVSRPVTWGDLDARSPLVHRAIALAENAVDADFHSLSEALVEHAEQLVAAHDLAGVVARRLPAPAERHPAELEQALLRVRRDAASLRTEPPPVISAERFTRIYDDVKTIEAFVPTRRHTARGPQAPDKEIHAGVG